MKTEAVLLGLLLLTAIGLWQHDSGAGLRFEQWRLVNHKRYGTEYTYRMGIWLQNEKYVEEHNRRYEQGLESYTLGMNIFADLTNEEYQRMYLGWGFNQAPTGDTPMTSVSKTEKCKGSQPPSANIPDSVDWEKTGAVTPIKNQGQCGSCWAFSTTGSLEGVHYKVNNVLKSFSEQQLVDCSHTYGNNGCGGGWMNSSFFYVVDNGITLESKYPYRGIQGKCNYNDSTDKVWSIQDCTEVTVDKELSLRAAVALNPVSVAIEANHISFQLYRSGVYSGMCGTKLDHGVLAVGYGEMNSKKYWKVKNSWGAGWGEKGYIFIENTGDGKGKCGIQMAASYPIA